MGPVDHIIKLMNKGMRHRQLLGLGFSKNALTRAKARLREEEEIELHANQVQGKEDRVIENIEELNSIRQRLEELESRAKTIPSNDEIQKMIDKTPILYLRDNHTCACGAKGKIGYPIECTSCGKKSLFGWKPEQE